MNPTEIYQFVAQLVRDGAEVIAASLVALVVGTIAGWKCTELFWRRRWDDLSTRCGERGEELRTLLRENVDLRTQVTHYLTTLMAQVELRVQELLMPIIRERDELRQEYSCVQMRLQEEESRVRRFEDSQHDLQNRYENTVVELQNANNRIEEIETQLQLVVAQSGRIWERPVVSNAIPFVPHGRNRKCCIISMLNLKGGVGKTTLTLNLAATLACNKKRVLMIDCDHQRSLSAMTIRQSRRVELHRARQTLQHFLIRGEHQSRFVDCIQDLSTMAGCSIIVNTATNDDDGLATVEDQLLLRWITQSDQEDVRLLLRKELHHSHISQQFDYVLIDCPPRLSVATINAIGVSDYILTPVGPDTVSSTNPLLLLLRELNCLRRNTIFPEVDFLGVVLNNARFNNRGTLVDHINRVWSSLPDHTRSAWYRPVHFFDTQITHSPDFQRSAINLINESDHALAVRMNDNIEAQFQSLAQEIEERIIHENPNLESIPS